MNKLFVKGLLSLAEQYKVSPTYTNPYDILECIDLLSDRGLLSEEDGELLHYWAADCFEM